MKKSFLLLLLGIFLSPHFLSATHLYGGYIHYESDNNPGDYNLYLHLYADCSGLPPAASIDIMMEDVCGAAPTPISLALLSQSDVTPICSGTSSCNGGSGPGVREVIYKATVPIAGLNCGQFRFYYEECCLNASLANISNPSSFPFFISTDTLNYPSGPLNVSPIFSNTPPIYVCNNQAISFSLSALSGWDPDSLVYSLAAPLVANGVTASYNLGYTPTAPMGGTWNVTLNNATGAMSISPTSGTGAIGTYLMTVRVDRYLNGSPKGTTYNNIQVTTVNCATVPVNCCHAFMDYTMTTSGGASTVNFTSTLYGGATPTTYSWDFGDGTGAVGSNPNPTHVYSLGGNYHALLTIDGSGGCTDTTYVDIHIPSSSLGVLCTNTDLGGGNYEFEVTNVTGGTPPYTYSWLLGGGTQTGGGPNPIQVNFPTPGSYSLSATVTDANGITGYCSQTITYTPPCVADYTYTTSGTTLPVTVTFTDLSQISGGATWFWDFGDGTAGNTQNPVHVYPIAGSYQVCLTVGDNTGCVDTVCQMINIGTGIDLDGYIYASPAQVDTYKVYLIEYSAVGGGTLTALDSQIVSGSPAYYNFGSISPLVYYTKAAMIPTSPSYSSFMPTYHDSVLFWSNATPINFMSGPPPTGGDIWMVQGNNPGGLGFIGGLISQGANKTNTIAENIEILLFDDNMNPITHVASDINGAFAFPNLAYGTYKIYPEMINKVTIPFTVTLNATQPSINDIDFIIQHDSIYATNTVAITPPSFIVESVGFPHPNPTKDWLNMDISLKQAAEIHFEVYTLTGQVVHRQSAKIEAGTFTETIHLGSLAQGFYLLRVLEGNQQIGNFKIVKD